MTVFLIICYFNRSVLLQIHRSDIAATNNIVNEVQILNKKCDSMIHVGWAVLWPNVIGVFRRAETPIEVEPLIESVIIIVQLISVIVHRGKLLVKKKS